MNKILKGQIVGVVCWADNFVLPPNRSPLGSPLYGYVVIDSI